MDIILQHLKDLTTIDGMFLLINIILIDIVMSGDNAILIGMATRKLHGKERKRAIFFGIILATLLRIVFAFFAVYLLSLVGIKLAGGILLLYVVWKFYRELRSADRIEHHINVKKTGLLAAIYTIIIADVSMSLDNVLAVAGAANENTAALGIGLIVSILLMAFASHFIASYLDKYPQIQWVGLLVILFVSMDMILSGTIEIEKNYLHIQILPFLLFVFGAVFIVLHTKYINAVDEQKIQAFFMANTFKFLAVIVVFLIGMLFFGNTALSYVQSHAHIFYSLVVILFFCLLELISLARVGQKQK